MKNLLFITICILLFSTLQAQEAPHWARYSAISPDGTTIAFTYKGDIYSVPTQGGVANQLTFHTAHDYGVVWSTDGKSLAFASNRFGNFDVFTMDAKGGSEKRLPSHSTDETPYTFSVDNTSVLFGAARQDAVTHRQYPISRQPELYSVPVIGGRVDQILTVPAEDVQLNKNGNEMLYHDKKGYEDTFRKHHVSAITRDIWKYNMETGQHTMLTTFKGEDRNPVYASNEKEMY